MGRIKTTLIKRTAKKLFAHYKEQFTQDFTQNKPIVQELVPEVNKKLRNIIAGYVTRLAKRKSLI